LDFDNVLFNKKNREIEVSLPFIFLGIKHFYASMKFIVPSSKNVYQAKLRSIEIVDKSDNAVMMSFVYKDATENEKEKYKIEFQKERQEYEENKKKKDNEEQDIFSYSFQIPPLENPLEGYIVWEIRLDKLKKYLKELLDLSFG
jgi:hypothetical protein